MATRLLPNRFGLMALMVGIMMFTIPAQSAQAENWGRFRGENGTGVSPLKGLPTTWSPGDYAWNIELPGVGHSAPVIWGDHLFVTSAVDEGAGRHLFCIDANDGTRKWDQAIGMNRSHKHAKSSWASSTPATDGERVYVAFADKENHLLAAYSFEGELLWRRNLGSYESQHGQGVSPIIFENLVILPNDQRGPSSVMAFDKATGHTVWSVLRKFREAAYSTPIIVQEEGQDPQLILVSGINGVSSLDPYTGRRNWHTREFPLRTVASPVYGEGLVIASCGQGGRYGVLLRAIDPSGSGDVTDTHIKWERTKELPYVPTPIVYGKHLYLWNDNGTASCVEIATGKNVWTKRIGGNYSGSPVCVDGKLYCVSESGDVVVIAASPEYERFGKVSLGDPSHSTPAVANGALYLRTYHRLMCLRAEK